MRSSAANLVWGSLGCWLFFATFGNTALHDQLTGKVPVIQIMNEVSPQAAIVAVVNALPMGTFVLILFVAMAFIYSATTLQASAYTIASVASRDLVAGESEPLRWNRLFWALALGGMAVALMYLGGSETAADGLVDRRAAVDCRHLPCASGHFSDG